MTFDLKGKVTNYFKKKKPLSIFFDAVFVIFVVLMLIPSTRTEVSSLLIRLTSLPPSSLDADDQYKINKQSLNWQVYDLQGKQVPLGSLTDKPVFLNFWATWCPPCVAEIPAIVELHEEFKDEVNFLLVSNESVETVKSFAEKKGYKHLPFYFSTSTPSDFFSQSIPTTFVISKEGKVVLSKKGAARWNSDKMEKLFRQLIDE